MTSAELATLLRVAEAAWFDTALRKRLRDGERMKWKERFMARAITLIQRWHTAAKERGHHEHFDRTNPHVYSRVPWMRELARSERVR